jgi:hypothetical protein
MTDSTLLMISKTYGLSSKRFVSLGERFLSFLRVLGVWKSESDFDSMD